MGYSADFWIFAATTCFPELSAPYGEVKAPLDRASPDS
jgi:hypothetical protein